MPDSEILSDAVESPRLDEMMRIMDVATTLRKEREVVERELNLDQIKDHIRKKLLDAASVTGEAVTEAEVATAIELYYDRMHSFKEPKKSVAVLFAHAYVRRGTIFKTALIVLGGWTLVWFLLLSPEAPFSSAAKDARAHAVKTERVEAIATEIKSSADHVRTIAREEESLTMVNDSLRELALFVDGEDVSKLTALKERVAGLLNTLEDDYTIFVVSGPNVLSGIDRTFRGGATKYYLLVEAKTAEGKVLSRRIRTAEKGSDAKLERVKRWGEEVPKEVYDRLVLDKRDGILNENIFGMKRRGFSSEEVTIRTDAGGRVERSTQITAW